MFLFGFRYIARKRKNISWCLALIIGKSYMVNRDLRYLKRLSSESVSIQKIMLVQGYSTIGIYGMGKLGKLFYEQIVHTKIKVCYGIDRNTNIQIPCLNIRTVENVRQDMDAVIVTSEFYYDEIVEQLQDKVKCPIILLTDLLNEYYGFHSIFNMYLYYMKEMLVGGIINKV